MFVTVAASLVRSICIHFLVDCKSNTTAFLYHPLLQPGTLLSNSCNENQSIDMTVQLDNVTVNEAYDAVYQYVKSQLMFVARWVLCRALREVCSTS